MAGLSSAEVTMLLRAWNLGNEKALQELVPLVYEELHRLAHLYMSGEKRGHMLQTTALVNEAYFRLAKLGHIEWKNREQLLAVSAKLMRRILVDHARRQTAEKRGGKVQDTSFDESLLQPSAVDQRLLALDEALQRLAELDHRKSKVVELRYFGGLSVAETASVLGVSPETVMRDWRFAKAWLLRQLSTGSRPERLDR